MIHYIIIIIIIIISYIIIKCYQFLQCPKEFINIPSLPTLNFFKFLLSRKSFDHKLKDYFQPGLDQFGLIRVFTLQGWALFIADPRIAKEIQSKPEIFGKRDLAKFKMSANLVKFFGKNQIAINNGEEWMRQRKIINPIFNKSWSPELFGSCAQDLIDEWEKMDGQEVKVHSLIQRMTLDVLGKAIFDIDFQAVKDPNSKLYNIYTNIFKQMFSNPLYIVFPILEKIPSLKRSKLSKELTEYDEFIENMVNSRRTELHNSVIKRRDNLLDALIRSNETTDETKLTVEEIKDNIKTFIIAGHDTTSNTLTGTLYYLTRYPEIQDRLRQEILEAMEHPQGVAIPTVEQLKNVPYMDLVIKESMRIMTTASALQRFATKRHTLSNGVVIPEGTRISLHSWGIHHNPSIFSNPTEFNPDRFQDLSSEESRSWQPFLTGARSCIGMTLSMMEQRVTIGMLLQKFEFSMTRDNPDYDELRLCPISLVCPKDLNVTISVRC